MKANKSYHTNNINNILKIHFNKYNSKICKLDFKIYQI